MISPAKINRHQKKISNLIGGKAVIQSWTIIRVAAKSFSPQAPYPVVIVKMEAGGQAVGQLVDWREEDLVKNRKVIAVLRRSGLEDKESVINYTIKFKPL